MFRSSKPDKSVRPQPVALSSRRARKAPSAATGRPKGSGHPAGQLGGKAPKRRRERRGWIAVFLALVFLVGLAAAPWAYRHASSPPWVAAAAQAVPFSLTQPGIQLRPVKIAPVAQPVRPQDAAPVLPSLDSTQMAALVSAEDQRLRTLVHHSNRITAPAVVSLRVGPPTLVLPGPGSYTIADLQDTGAVVAQQKPGVFLLVDNVLVTRGATLKLGGSGITTLLMDSSPSGFTSLVTWGGSLNLAGDSAQSPLNIVGWDEVKNAPATVGAYGRPYIRAAGGRLDVKYVRASSLGFWSGRTGGVAWTGISSRVSTGSATASVFESNIYGAFLTRTDHVTFTDVLFEGNGLDGLRIHRNSASTTVTGSVSARNGGNGFVVSRGATGTTLRSDIAIHNSGNGFLMNGQPLVNGAGPSGGGSVASTGTVLELSESVDNAHTAILVEGGVETVIRDNIVSGPITGIAVRAGASGTIVAGNDVRSAGRIALSIGPGVTGTTVAANNLNSARIGILIRNSAGVRIMYNRVSRVGLFAISVRGNSPGVVGNDNVLAGKGFNAIDVRSGAQAPVMTTTDLSGWQRRSSLGVIGYLRYHPILTTWLAILVLVVVFSIIAKVRRRESHPYRYGVPWTPAGHPIPYVNAPPRALPVPLSEAGMGGMATAGTAAKMEP